MHIFENLPDASVNRKKVVKSKTGKIIIKLYISENLLKK